jgi:small subunit ribosomal protein S3
MIERDFVKQKIKEFEIKEYIQSNLSNVGLRNVEMKRTPLGIKLVISASKPGLVVGKKGSNINKLTEDLKVKFKLENPQIELEEVEKPYSHATIVAEEIVNSLERFGSNNFKSIGYNVMEKVMREGDALGVEILISGKVPSARARVWRFYKGYLKKCGNIAYREVDKSFQVAKLKTGTIGIKVSIMKKETKLPDDIILKKEDMETEFSEVEKDKELEEKKEQIEKDKIKEDKKPEEKTEKEKKKTKKKKDSKPKKAGKKDDEKAKTKKKTEKSSEKKKTTKKKGNKK